VKERPDEVQLIIMSMEHHNNEHSVSRHLVCFTSDILHASAYNQKYNCYLITATESAHASQLVTDKHLNIILTVLHKKKTLTAFSLPFLHK